MRGQGQAPNLAKCQPSVPLAGSIQRSGTSPGTRVQHKKIRQHRARPRWTTRKRDPNRPSLCRRQWSASRREDSWLGWLVAFIKLIKENMNLHSPQRGSRSRIKEKNLSDEQEIREEVHGWELRLLNFLSDKSPPLPKTTSGCMNLDTESTLYCNIYYYCNITMILLYYYCNITVHFFNIHNLSFNWAIIDI